MRRKKSCLVRWRRRRRDLLFDRVDLRDEKRLADVVASRLLCFIERAICILCRFIFHLSSDKSKSMFVYLHSFSHSSSPANVTQQKQKQKPIFGRLEDSAAWRVFVSNRCKVVQIVSSSLHSQSTSHSSLDNGSTTIGNLPSVSLDDLHVRSAILAWATAFEFRLVRRDQHERQSDWRTGELSLFDRPFDPFATCGLGSTCSHRIRIVHFASLAQHSFGAFQFVQRRATDRLCSSSDSNAIIVALQRNHRTLERNQKGEVDPLSCD